MYLVKDKPDEIRYFIQELVIPSGRHAGQPFDVLPFQRRFLAGAFGQPDDAALSIARGNGKTTLCAGLLAAALYGPLAQPNGESVLVASSFEQALIGFRVLKAFMARGLRETRNAGGFKTRLTERQSPTGRRGQVSGY